MNIKKNFLFICSQNRLRSPTAEQIFSGRQGNSTRSAGTDKLAENQVSLDDIEWADLIFVMENRHKQSLQKKFSSILKNKKLYVLNIPDNYEFMDQELVLILEKKMKIFFD